MSDLPNTVVLFGAGGFIGRNIVDALAPKVANLIGVTASGRDIPGCRSVVAMDKLASIPALPADTVVINVAAYRYNAQTFGKEQSQILESNVAIANAVYGFCAERDIKEVRLASSSAVYPASWDVLDDEREFNLNEWPNRGEAAYGWSKRWAEICAQLYQMLYGINTIAFRLSNPYGPYDTLDVKAAHVATAFVIKALMPGDTFEILGNADSERDFMYAGDVANAFLVSLSHRGENGVYNLAFGETTTVRQLADIAVKVSKSKKTIQVAPVPPGGVRTRRLTVAKLRGALDLPPPTDLTEGLTKTMAWYRDVSSR